MKNKIKKLDSCPKITSCCGTQEKEIKITWTEVAQAEKYAIKRCDSYGGKFEVIGWTKGLEYADKDLTEDKTYWYKIFAVRKVSKKRKLVKESSSSCAVVSSLPAPYGLECELGNDEKVCIKWQADENADSFILLCRNGYSNQSVPVGETKVKCFYVENLVSGQLFYYSVQAVFKGEEGEKYSAFCEEFPVANLDCGEVYSLKKRFGKTSITVRVVAGADGYILERSTDGENFEEIARNEGETAIHFTDKFSGTRYYRTRAYKTVGEREIVSPASAGRKV